MQMSSIIKKINKSFFLSIYNKKTPFKLNIKDAVNEIKDSEVGSGLALSIFWSMAGAIISRGLMLCSMIIVARLLGSASYGELGMIQSTVSMIGVIAGFGLGLMATKYIAQFRQKDLQKTGRVIAIARLISLASGTLMALSLFVLSPWLASNSLNAPHLELCLKIGSLIVFFNALNSVQTGTLAGLESFKAIAIVNFVVGVLSFPILTLGVYYNGLTGVVWGLAINLIINWILNFIVLRGELIRNGVIVVYEGLKKELTTITNFAFPALLGTLMIGPANWLSRAILANQVDGYSELGLLTAALVFQALILFVGSTLSAPLLSILSKEAENATKKLKVMNMVISWSIGVFVAIPLLCFPEVIYFIFGNEYATNNFKVTFSLVVYSTIIIMYKEGLSRALVTNNLLWWGFLDNLLWAISVVSFSYLLVDFGAPGLSASLLISYIIITLLLLPVYKAKNVVPNKTMLSIEAICIWCVLTFLLLLNVCNVGFLLRSIVFLPSAVFLLYLFMRLYGNK
ncbi:oligosaccharide flippase family protein [Paraferrimonas sp. SM1919]|uniref:oligosaccharide flippase family protein n=1 Tax=Paraferrimonas sp. SM1919 TaxID=2662263 RepID=UPI0013D42CEA|nr:oligosaccharide flippase family protein [Paraferrimonas sp. SM1919]